MILEDPVRFQSRAAYPRDVMDDAEIGGAPGFRSNVAGLLSVWEDPDDKRLYVIDGHRRLRLAKRHNVPLIWVQCLNEECAADAFACGVDLNLAQWAFEGGDKRLWAIACRRASVERALHTRWLDMNGYWALQLYREYYPDLGRRYCDWPEGQWEIRTANGDNE